MKLVPPASWQEQPWANGRGTTREIVRWPEAAHGAYDVRVSLADVAADGPFSPFAGYRRWTFLAGAAPIALGDVELRALGDHLELPGETPITAALRAGPTQLLNVIARPGTVVGYGPTAHPVRFVFQLRDQRAHVGPPSRVDTGGSVWIA